MQIAPSGRQLEEQRTIEERSEKWIWKRLFEFPPERGRPVCRGEQGWRFGAFPWEPAGLRNSVLRQAVIGRGSVPEIWNGSKGFRGAESLIFTTVFSTELGTHFWSFFYDQASNIL